MSNIEKTLSERGNRYGDFSDHAQICQQIKRVMMGTPGWKRLTDVQRQALDVIADKQARILSGDPDYIDNWHDIQGYAKLVEDRLAKPEQAQAALGQTGLDQQAFRPVQPDEMLGAQSAEKQCECDTCVLRRAIEDAVLSAELKPGEVVVLPVPKGVNLTDILGEFMLTPGKDNKPTR